MFVPLKMLVLVDMASHMVAFGCSYVDIRNRGCDQIIMMYNKVAHASKVLVAFGELFLVCLEIVL